jgi:hypothetical protein
MKTANIFELAANTPMLKEWSEADFKRMKQALKSEYLFKPLHTHHGTQTAYTFADLKRILGLPYTSSSNYAGQWVTNTELDADGLPGFHIIGFAISEAGKCVAICWDKDENEKLIQIGK